MTPQAMTALELANEIRLNMVAVTREMKTGGLTLAEALDDPRAQRMRLPRLLAAQPRWGASKTVAALAAIGATDRRRVCELTDRQRELLLSTPPAVTPAAPRGRLMAREHSRLVRDREMWKRRAQLLERAVRAHQRMVQGPGPAAEFGRADVELWGVLDQIRREAA